MKEKLKYIKENYRKEPSLPLFILTFIYTLFIFGMIIWDSVDSSFYTPDPLIRFYTWFLVPGYIGLKARDRYILGIKWQRRSGERLVYLWCFTLLGLYTAERLSGGVISVPPITMEIAGSVVALYLGSISLNWYTNRKAQPPQRKSLINYDSGLDSKIKTTMIRQ